MGKETKELMQIAYDFYKGGMKLKDIATKLDKPYGTIKRWKSVYKWDNNIVAKANQKSEPKLKENEPLLSSKTNRKNNIKNIKQDIEKVLNNDKLTSQQQLFCLYYVQYFNANKAYQKAYNCSYINACSHSNRLLKNEHILKEISSLKQNRLNRELLKEDDIFQKYMDIAFSNMTDYITFEGDKLSLKDSNNVDGSLIDEISVGKAGIKVKLADRLKALEWLTKHMNLATDEQKLKLEYMKSKIEEIDKDNFYNIIIKDDVSE